MRCGGSYFRQARRLRCSIGGIGSGGCRLPLSHQGDGGDRAAIPAPLFSRKVSPIPLNLGEARHPPSQLVRRVAHSERRAAAASAARLAPCLCLLRPPPPVRGSLPFVLPSGARWYRFCCVVRASTVPDIFYRTPLKTLSANAVDHPPQEGRGPGLLCGRGGGAVRLYLLSP